MGMLYTSPERFSFGWHACRLRFELSRGQRVCSPGYDLTQSTLRCERYSLLPNGQG